MALVNTAIYLMTQQQSKWQCIVQQQQSRQILPVKSDSSHRLPGAVLRNGGGRSKGGRGRRKRRRRHIKDGGRSSRKERVGGG